MATLTADRIIEFPVSDEALLARARAIRDLLRKNARDADMNRRLPDENIRAMEEAGLFRVQRPRRYGGHQASLRTTLDVASEVARGCGSSAWVFTLANVGEWIVSLMPDAFQDEYFNSRAHPKTAGALATTGQGLRVDGGYKISGNWGYCSGILHADYAGGSFVMLDENGQMQGVGLAMIPMSEADLKDTWHVVGMRGSGSNTFVVNDVFVPDHRILHVLPAIGGQYMSEKNRTEALYRAAFVPVFALVLVGPFLGMARAALDLFMEKLPNRGIAYTKYAKQADAPITQFQLSKAAMLIDGAHLHAYRAADDIDGDAASGVYPDPVRRARIRMDCAQAVDNAKEAVNLLVQASGSSFAAEANPLQRIWRDVNTAASHAVLDYNVNLELYGRMILGHEPNTDLL